MTGTPTLVVGKTGGTPKLVEGFGYGEVKAATDAALADGGRRRVLPYVS